MKRTPVLFALMILLSCSFVLATCERHKEKPRLNPLTADAQIMDSVMAQFGKGVIASEEQFIATRNKFASKIIASVRTDSLEGESLLKYGQILYWSGNDRKARAVFENLRQGKDKLAFKASKEIITMDVEEGKCGKAEALMKEYRRAVAPDTSDLQYLWEQCTSLCDRYSAAGDVKAAIQVCLDELNALPFDAPYASFRLAGSIASFMMETGRIDECRALLDTYRAKMQSALALHLKSTVYPDSTAREKDSIVSGLQSYINSFISLSSQLDLVGKKAPGFKFLHMYNADSTFTLDKLRGKIVMIDFWATWCKPCIASFPEVRRIYEDYKAKGFEVLGITSLQGVFRDKDMGISEGSREKPLDRAREIELTASFIKKRNLIWPCAISDRSVFDPLYKIDAIPCFVLLDRDGNVRFIQWGLGEEKRNRRIIERLIKSS